MTLRRCRRRQRRLRRHRPGGEVEQSPANQGRDVLDDVERVQIDEHDLVLGNELAKIDRRSRLANDGSRHLAARVLVHLGLNGIDDLLAVAQLERIEVAAEPVPMAGSRPLEYAVPKPRNAEQVGHFQHVCCEPRPDSGSMRQIASLASNSAMSAKRKASSMRGPQKASNSRLNTRSALPTAWSRSQPRPTSSRFTPNGRLRLAISR